MIEYDRNQGIGGSDVPVIVGMSPYRSAIDLWDEKRGNAIEREPAIRMRLGQLLEDGIARLYAEQEGVKLSKPTKPYGMIRADDGSLFASAVVREKFGYPTWAQIDRVRVGKPRRGVEVKNTANPRRFSGDEVPDDVAVQVQHAMMLTGWQTFDVVSLSMGRDLKVTTVEADPEVHEAIADACRTFWRQVQTGEEPEPDGSDAAGRYIRERYNAVEPGKIAVATHDVLPQIAHVLSLAAAKKEIEQQLDAAKQAIMLFMEDAEQLDAPGDVKITWKQQGGRRDWKAIAADLRALIEANRSSGIAIPEQDDATTLDDWLDFIESMHTGQPSRVFRVTGKAVVL
jgi:predicted phage-related endonuclease